jgi:hypothetical protein
MARRLEWDSTLNVPCVSKHKRVPRDLSRQYPISRQTDRYFVHERIGLISPVIHENRIIGRGAPRFLGQCRLSYCSERLGDALCHASNLTDPAPPRGALNRGEISLRRLSLSLRAAFLESSGHSRRPMRRPLRLRTQRQFQLLSGTPIVRRNTPR